MFADRTQVTKMGLLGEQHPQKMDVVDISRLLEGIRIYKNALSGRSDDLFHNTPCVIFSGGIPYRVKII
jgi:hypothetical protein